MSLTKQDKKEIKETIQDEIIEVVSEVLQPEFNKLGGRMGIIDKKIDILGKKVDILSQDLSDFKQETKNNFMDVRRQISDLKIDTPTRSEFASHEKRIHRLEKNLSFV